jgi:TPP-dependent pyruvate/acetoin dehydrogenase alpha subunit
MALDTAQLAEMLRAMILIREFDELVYWVLKESLRQL